MQLLDKPFPQWSAKLSGVPTEPGVYLMRDADGTVIYVGKARNLQKRIASYLKSPARLDMKTGVLVRRIATVETILTATEKEALILESTLIKKHRPRYNVILKDDKRYPALRLDIRSDFPALTIVRKIQNDGSLYFGPFASAQAVRQTLKFINKTFKLRKCRAKDFKTRTRPCLHCQMQRCLAPCCLEVDPHVYGEVVREVALFLKGRAPELIRKVKAEMLEASSHQDFERAALLRDKALALEKTIERQVTVSTDFKDRDVVGIARSAESILVLLLFIRGGYLLGTRHFNFKESMASDAEILGAFLRQYYEKAHFVPREILVPLPLEDDALLEDWLATLKGATVKILRPRRGEKVRLTQLAQQNAANRLGDLKAAGASDGDLLRRLQQWLRLRRLPLRIECFDNSNISGSAPVAGMVVFQNAQPLKAAYRQYKIRTVADQDDYAYMTEVLSRRFRRDGSASPLPDLLMVDGGKGQLNVALAVMRSLQLEDALDVIGIAKREEKKGETEDKIYKPGRLNPLAVGREKDLLLLLQRIRDEAHRFTIAFHRRRRARHSLRSALDVVAGIGPRRKATLLHHFGSVKKIRAATRDELSALPGISRNLAEVIQKELAETAGPISPVFSKVP
jgi:excinuclease ABC subunit C